ncbi:Mobile element protein (plasmid) [Sinorhizobium fredii CCBAU 25509]|nr:Mobile element protein [Sinorhizobium fredii CCBAU 25509]
MACRWLPHSSADDWFFNSPRVHFMRNVLAHAGKSGRRVVSAFIATAFAQETPQAASTQWRAGALCWRTARYPYRAAVPPSPP